MKFTKMQGLGNDYIYVFSDSEPVSPNKLSVKLSDRHFGIGSDGMVWILPSDFADYKMRIFNADGSEAKMCGNGIRCVGKYLYDKRITDKTELKIETESGIKTLFLNVKNNLVESVTVDMGAFETKESLTLYVCGTTVSCVPVSMGNPHAVIFTDDAENAPLTTVGATLENNRTFPDGVNVEFVELREKNMLRMRVWERGSGITMACGTGACASAVAAVSKGMCDINTDISVILDGGVLNVRILPNRHVIMTGPAEFVYDGEVNESATE